jgi:hypothetical protein
VFSVFYYFVELLAHIQGIKMKFSNYFLYTRQRLDRKDIKMDWIERVFLVPEYEYQQVDGRKRKWGYIKEVDKYLRVVVLEDNETIHNAFFDRDFKKQCDEDNIL